MDEKEQAVLVLEDGTVFHGNAIGIKGKASGELVFNTGMSGYQEVFTDPSNFGQILVMTTCHIGNYGITSSDSELEEIQCSGIVVKKFSENISRKLADSSLQDLMRKSNTVGISDIDTRALVRYLRTKGSMNAIVSTEENFSVEDLKKEVLTIPSMLGLKLADKVSIKESILFNAASGSAKYKVAMIDFGSMRNIARYLNHLECEVKVFPIHTPMAEIMKYNPDGIVLSNGPGDPAAMTSSIRLTKEIINSNLPVFGINLGHQLIALSMGATTEKTLHGHRGSNHPVINHLTGKCEITSQNNGFVVTRESIEKINDLEITHSHLNDQNVEGIRLKNKPVFSVQFNPEPSVGPNDSIYLFDQFIKSMNK